MGMFKERGITVPCSQYLDIGDLEHEERMINLKDQVHSVKSLLLTADLNTSFSDLVKMLQLISCAGSDEEQENSTEDTRDGTQPTQTTFKYLSEDVHRKKKKKSDSSSQSTNLHETYSGNENIESNTSDITTSKTSDNGSVKRKKKKREAIGTNMDWKRENEEYETNKEWKMEKSNEICPEYNEDSQLMKKNKRSSEAYKCYNENEKNILDNVTVKKKRKRKPSETYESFEGIVKRFKQDESEQYDNIAKVSRGLRKDNHDSTETNFIEKVQYLNGEVTDKKKLKKQKHSNLYGSSEESKTIIKQEFPDDGVTERKKKHHKRRETYESSEEIKPMIKEEFPNDNAPETKKKKKQKHGTKAYDSSEETTFMVKEEFRKDDATERKKNKKQKRNKTYESSEEFESRIKEYWHNDEVTKKNKKIKKSKPNAICANFEEINYRVKEECNEDEITERKKKKKRKHSERCEYSENIQYIVKEEPCNDETTERKKLKKKKKKKLKHRETYENSEVTTNSRIKKEYHGDETTEYEKTEKRNKSEICESSEEFQPRVKEERNQYETTESKKMKKQKIEINVKKNYNQDEATLRKQMNKQNNDDIFESCQESKSRIKERKGYNNKKLENAESDSNSDIAEEKYKSKLRNTIQKSTLESFDESLHEIDSEIENLPFQDDVNNVDISRENWKQKYGTKNVMENTDKTGETNDNNTKRVPILLKKVYDLTHLKKLPDYHRIAKILESGIPDKIKAGFYESNFWNTHVYLADEMITCVLRGDWKNFTKFLMMFSDAPRHYKSFILKSCIINFAYNPDSNPDMLESFIKTCIPCVDESAVNKLLTNLFHLSDSIEDEA